MGFVPIYLNAAAQCQDAFDLERDLKRKVVGQDQAIEQIVHQYQTYLAGLTEPGKPISSLLLLGPTGCGKTRLAEAVAECLAGTRQALIKVDCGEFQHSHEIAKLIGSPPGYLGHRETGARLSQDRLDEFHTDSMKLSFVLFDEIEKASDALWNLLLGILDKGTLTLGDNRQVDFSRAMVLMTGNLGSAEMQRLSNAPVGFSPGGSASAATQSLALRRRMEKSALEAARRKFSPEFLNRLDGIIFCGALDRDGISKVLELELKEIAARIQRQRGSTIRISLQPDAREYLLNDGFDDRYGARHLKRTLSRHFVRPLSSFLSTGQLQDGDELLVGVDAERKELTFHREARQAIIRTFGETRCNTAATAAAPQTKRQWNATAIRG